MTTDIASGPNLVFDRPPGAEEERPAHAVAGIPVLLAVLVAGIAVALLLVGARPYDVDRSIALLVVAGVLAVVDVVVAFGFFMLRPNKAAVLTLFGNYKGSVRQPGLWWANPLYGKTQLSLRVRNFDTDTAKVNDANGNPIEIGAVVVWQIVDTAKAAFQVEEVVEFVAIQSEAAVRNLAREYPYDTWDDVDDLPVGSEPAATLIGNAEAVNHQLDIELQERLQIAGVRVIEARLTHLSYAPEIAEVMLRKQQASAIVAARKKIVEGAVWMVQSALESLEAGVDGQDAIPLDEHHRAVFASNLMTVIASDHPTTPVVNVGTLAR